jgi:hypothetical protein
MKMTGNRMCTRRKGNHHVTNAMELSLTSSKPTPNYTANHSTARFGNTTIEWHCIVLRLPKLVTLAQR